MLARMAEYLYWLARYMERADITLRLLTVQEQTGTEVHGYPWSDLARVCELPSTLHSRMEITHELLRSDSCNSIRFSLRQARENGRIVRDRLTTEVWTALNSFYLEFEKTADTADLGTPDTLYEWMRAQCERFWGAIDSTLIRDEGWAWLCVGRFLERTSATCRILAVMGDDVSPGSESGAHRTAALLRFVSGSHAFRRISSGSPEAPEVMAFLLRSAMFPRSLAWSVRETHGALRHAGFARTRAARRLHNLHSQLDLLDLVAENDSMAHLLQTVQQTLDQSHVDLAAEVFGLDPNLMAGDHPHAL
jgi:uncharacterized alpha-E superfamily protein